MPVPRINDRVRLKTGGRTMRIVAPSPEDTREVLCVWIDGEPQHGSFVLEELELVLEDRA